MTGGFKGYFLFADGTPQRIGQEFEALKEAGVKNPESHMLKTSRRQGQYQGCFAKWAKSREAHNWDLLVKAAPNITKKASEVPNVLRESLGIDVSWLVSQLWHTKTK